MNPPTRIRPFQPTHAEYAAVARINDLAPPGERQDFEPRTGADLRAFDESFDPARHTLRRLVAEDAATGQLVGFAHFFHMPWAFDPRRFWCAVRCDPGHRRRGIGGRLYAEILDELARRGATHARMMARDTLPEAVRRLERRGYREVLRSWEFELSLDRPEDPRWAGRAGAAPGVEIAPLSEIAAGDPGWLAQVHALYVEVMRDVPLPGPLRIDPPPSWLEDHLLRWPTSLPDACLVARDGSAHVGLCILHRSDEDPGTLDHLLTGVASAHRGRGIGAALKLATIAHGRARGYRRIRTAVESNNPRMLALNEALGFVKRGGLILLEAELPGAGVAP